MSQAMQIRKQDYFNVVAILHKVSEGKPFEAGERLLAGQLAQLLEAQIR
jgi:hypothetical protein